MRKDSQIFVSLAEKPMWDSDNWPLMVDFVDSKDIYMAEHGNIGLCMAPGRKKKKKRYH